jgi:hypothetical protein
MLIKGTKTKLQEPEHLGVIRNYLTRRCKIILMFQLEYIAIKAIFFKMGNK